MKFPPLFKPLFRKSPYSPLYLKMHYSLFNALWKTVLQLHTKSFCELPNKNWESSVNGDASFKTSCVKWRCHAPCLTSNMVTLSLHLTPNYKLGIL